MLMICNMNMTKCHRVAIPRDPMCGLYLIRKRHDHATRPFTILYKRQRRDKKKYKLQYFFFGRNKYCHDDVGDIFC